MDLNKIKEKITTFLEERKIRKEKEKKKRAKEKYYSRFDQRGNELFVWVGNDDDDSGYAVTIKIKKGRASKLGIKKKRNRYSGFVLTKINPQSKSVVVRIKRWDHSLNGSVGIRKFFVLLEKRKRGAPKRSIRYYDSSSWEGTKKKRIWGVTVGPKKK